MEAFDEWCIQKYSEWLCCLLHKSKAESVLVLFPWLLVTARRAQLRWLSLFWFWNSFLLLIRTLFGNQTPVHNVSKEETCGQLRSAKWERRVSLGEFDSGTFMSQLCDANRLITTGFLLLDMVTELWSTNVCLRFVHSKSGYFQQPSPKKALSIGYFDFLLIFVKL